jgi:hypothetical protein
LVKYRVLVSKTGDAIDMLMSIMKVGVAGMAKMLVPQKTFGTGVELV